MEKVPVNEVPNLSSEGGMSFEGVVVFVMVSFEGSMLGS